MYTYAAEHLIAALKGLFDFQCCQSLVKQTIEYRAECELSGLSWHQPVHQPTGIIIQSFEFMAKAALIRGQIWKRNVGLALNAAMGLWRS